MKRQGGSWVIHIPSREQNLMQVRPAGQAGYPISLVASLDTVPVKCCVPLHKWLENLVEQTTNNSKKQTEGSFTSVQMVHTHTLTSDIYTYDRYTHTHIYIHI
jgi:hypothetical protein